MNTIKKLFIIGTLLASVIMASAQVSYNAATILTTNALVGTKALAGPTTPVNVTLYDKVDLLVSCVVSNGSQDLWCGAGNEVLTAYFGMSYDGSKPYSVNNGTAASTNWVPIVHTVICKYNTNQIGNGVTMSVGTNITVGSAGYLHLLYITNAGSVATTCLTNVQVKVIKKPFIKGGREGGD